MTNYEYQMWRKRNNERLWNELAKQHPEYGITVTTFEEKIMGNDSTKEEGTK